MPEVHRDDDLRECTATTVVIGNSTVFVNNKLCAVEHDPDTHLAGNLVSTSPGTVYAENKKVIVITDTNTWPDLAGHASPSDDPDEGSPNVFAY